MCSNPLHIFKASANPAPIFEDGHGVRAHLLIHRRGVANRKPIFRGFYIHRFVSLPVR